ncbi:MerR family transcriptional regulator [Longispora fulva]|uniref:DNA-binding transcriptional MerR regulator n=1 Tax=Longispora fulva TaxID=619741 RepID=A0A8J7GJL7_9ACTN|nr:MerR family transcriptional regulator [Longispora fulva]MBG6137992.1 DNA-binding transcriptional MerR regulator [Longispora fulva]GIG60245.1 MerR family transcriptional regulator [Longispora fulva]
MEGEHPLYGIGDLARRTGLSVKTIRYYSDAGLVPPTDRSPVGYRLYDLDALARLDLVRTLRDLGVDLATIRRVLDRELGIAEVATMHVEALDAQIATLRLRRAVLRAVAKRGSDPKEMSLMHKLARLSDAERRQMLTDFHDEVFADLDVNPEFAAKLRTTMPELPDDPTPTQVEAWIELAELVGDPDFRTRTRRMAELHAADRESQDHARSYEGWEQAGMEFSERGVAAADAGVDPTSAEGRAIIDELVGLFVAGHGGPDTPEFRTWLIEQVEVGSDARVERYWQLIGTINGWPVWPSRMHGFAWLVAALRA